ncbi:MAG: YdbL family protein [Syntrophotaleaceae bacterium]
MKKFSWIFSVTAVCALLSCVTINIYFPAEEVRNAADRIVNEVWGERSGQPAETPPEAAPGPGAWLQLLMPATAHAAQDIDVSTPEIRAIKEAMKQRTAALQPLLQGGQIGIGADGLLIIRDLAGLDLRSRGQAKRLVEEENGDRMRLYQEIARANDFPDKAAEVQAIFADSWRQQAPGGWYLQDGNGAWRRK